MTTSYSASGIAAPDPGTTHVRTLRAFLKLDALASGLLGLLLVAASGQLATLLGLPTALLAPVGVFLVMFAVWVWRVGAPATPAPAAVRAIIFGNVLWVVASVIVAAAGWFSPTTLGTAFILVQAIAVAVFAGGQSAGLRRAGPPQPRGSDE